MGNKVTRFKVGDRVSFTWVCRSIKGVITQYNSKFMIIEVDLPDRYENQKFIYFDNSYLEKWFKLHESWHPKKIK